MVTEEEKQEIINLAVEKAMLMLPEVVGNLMANHVALAKINTQFYTDHPEFRDRKDIVASVIEQMDGENPLMKYEELLSKAVPRIKERMAISAPLDTSKVSSSPNRNFKGNGEI